MDDVKKIYISWYIVLNMKEIDNVLRILREAKRFIEEDKANELKSLSNQTVHAATISQDADNIVVAVLVTFVLPAFIGMYDTMGAELPAVTRLLLTMVDLFKSSGIYLLMGLAATGLLAAVYTRTPAGKYQWDQLLLRVPLLGRYIQLNELARCCRSMSLLFRSGLPLTEIMSMVAEGSTNRVIRDSLIEVQQAMLKGEGLSQPMSKNRVFLPMMVQMVKVGEETGNLDVTLLATAQAYDAEADDQTRALVGFIQPAMTLGIGLVVAFITIALLSAMYSVFGQIG